MKRQFLCVIVSDDDMRINRAYSQVQQLLTTIPDARIKTLTSKDGSLFACYKTARQWLAELARTGFRADTPETVIGGIVFIPLPSGGVDLAESIEGLRSLVFSSDFDPISVLDCLKGRRFSLSIGSLASNEGVNVIVIGSKEQAKATWLLKTRFVRAGARGIYHLSRGSKELGIKSLTQFSLAALLTFLAICMEDLGKSQFPIPS